MQQQRRGAAAAGHDHTNPLLAPRRRRLVAVYRGEGAGWRSVASTADALKRLLPPSRYDVAPLGAAELLEGSWRDRAALLVMPGGADLPYCRRLNGAGNALIRDFVAGGGAYLGLCAGAYYACSRVEFEPGSPMAVVGARELGFFPGTARGAVVAGEAGLEGREEGRACSVVVTRRTSL